MMSVLDGTNTSQLLQSAIHMNHTKAEQIGKMRLRQRKSEAVAPSVAIADLDKKTGHALESVHAPKSNDVLPREKPNFGLHEKKCFGQTRMGRLVAGGAKYARPVDRDSWR